jgi:hypothetical protein
MRYMLDYAQQVETEELPSLRAQLDSLERTPQVDDKTSIESKAIPRLRKTISEWEAIVSDIRAGRPL